LAPADKAIISLGPLIGPQDERQDDKGSLYLPPGWRLFTGVGAFPAKRGKEKQGAESA
jgi:hypothetical protein